MKLLELQSQSSEGRISTYISCRHLCYDNFCAHHNRQNSESPDMLNCTQIYQNAISLLVTNNLTKKKQKNKLRGP
jgi:hypothetical protein